MPPGGLLWEKVLRIDPQTLLEGKNDEVDEVFSMFLAVIVLLNKPLCSLMNF